MPEGDTIFRAARTLDKALKGEIVDEFRTVLPALARVDHDAPLHGREVTGVEAVGKHLLMHFSGGLTLRTHLRMHGSWHIYRRGERWRRPGHAMRVAILTKGWEAVGFNIPVAEFLDDAQLAQSRSLNRLGPDLLSDDWNPAEARNRILATPDRKLVDVLLDQAVLAGIGNVFKSEILFLVKIHPERCVRTLTEEEIEAILTISRRLLTINVIDPSGGNVTWGGSRRTTGRAEPGAKLWVYGRGGKPCRRCGTPVQRALTGTDARPTYWCPRCQPQD